MASTAEPSRRDPITGRFAALARHMQASVAVPTATTMRTFEVPLLDRYVREVPREDRVSLGCVLAYAVVAAARAVPAICSRFEEVDGKPYVVHGGATHLGVAVDAPDGRGARLVLVPAIKDASHLGFAEFANCYADLTTRARDGQLRLEELQGANLIVTNTAAFGSTTGVARLPVGMGAIVALGTITYPPGLSRLATTLDIDRIMSVSCTYDHRVIQGGDSGQFLDALARTVGDPEFYARLDTGGDGPSRPGEAR